MSEALEYLLRKNGLENIKDPEIIKTVLNPLVQDDNILNEGDSRLNVYKLGKNPGPVGSYLRDIKGVGTERKALYGIPCLDKNFSGEGCDRTCITTLERTPTSEKQSGSKKDKSSKGGSIRKKRVKSKRTYMKSRMKSRRKKRKSKKSRGKKRRTMRR